MTIVGDPALIAVTPNPQQIAGPVGEGSSVLIVNLDLITTVYIGYSRGIGVGSSNVLAIPPLGSTTADASRAVWAVSNPPVFIQVLPGGASWSPSPAQIAEQISLAGINVNITGINVLAPSGDTSGATDRAKINSQLASPGIGQVNLQPGGIYYVDSPILLKSFTGLNGGNMRQMAIPTGNYGIGGLAFGGAIIKPVGGFAGSAVFLMASPGAVQQGNADLRCMSMDGSLLPAGTVHCIEAQGAWAGVTIRDFLAYKYTGKGLYPHNDGTSQPDFWHVGNSKFSAGGGNGIDIAGLADSWFTDVESTGNTGDNWAVTNGNNSRFDNCKGEFSGSGYGLRLVGGPGFTGHVTFNNFGGGNNALGLIDVSGTGTGTFEFNDPYSYQGVPIGATVAGSNLTPGLPVWRAINTFANGMIIDTAGFFEYQQKSLLKVQIEFRNLQVPVGGWPDAQNMVAAVNGLPAGYRPTRTRRYIVDTSITKSVGGSYGMATVLVNTDGSIDGYGMAALARLDGSFELALD
jgi:hypothetical protein